MIDVSAAPLELVVAVVNGWSERIRETAGIADQPHPSLAEILDQHSWVMPLVGDGQLRPFADVMHVVFAGDSIPVRLAVVNQEIERLAPMPVLTQAGQQWLVAEEWSALEASLVLAIVEHVPTDPELLRLGACTARRCVDAYVDTTQAVTRRYCSLTCQNRTKATRRRQRHRFLSENAR